TQTVNANNTDVTIAAPADHSNDGLHTVSYWATDNATNEETPHNSTTVRIDRKSTRLNSSHTGISYDAVYSKNKTPPDAPSTDHHAPTHPSAPNASTATPPNLPTFPTRRSSDLTQTVNANNTDVTIAAPADHSNDGLHTVSYWATDNATNEETPHNSTTVR